MWQTLRELPPRLLKRLGVLWASGALGGFIQGHLAPLIGLLALLILLPWSIRRVSGPTTARLKVWQGRAQTLTWKAVLSLGEIIQAHLLLLATILWVWLSLWSLGLLEVPACRVFLHLLVALGLLRLGRHWLRLVFAGKRAGGLLPLEGATARFYRR